MEGAEEEHWNERQDRSGGSGHRSSYVLAEGRNQTQVQSEGLLCVMFMCSVCVQTPCMVGEGARIIACVGVCDVQWCVDEECVYTITSQKNNNLRNVTSWMPPPPLEYVPIALCPHSGS